MSFQLIANDRAMILPNNRPHTTVVLAMSADGKIADQGRSPARFASPADKDHLEEQIAAVDGVLFGAGTLRAYGSTIRVLKPQLIQQRYQKLLPPQPVQIVVSASGNIDRQLSFFRQPVPRYLLTTSHGAKPWQNKTEFDQVIVCQASTKSKINWINALEILSAMGLKRLAVLGGGEIVAAMLAADLIDELWLTICPLLLGGNNAPTPVGGEGFREIVAPRLELVSAKVIVSEVFLHYRRQREDDLSTL
ncbi:RibD family protein [Synechocystis sp. PCC 7509]|uniref:RibD family protein n=1 Tax=Synechocystis sp. PCC 7509 TaxID=927677 RepID=UPI0002DB0872|nr:RibD family protein [Synechocystis sp. PCC 7509]